MRETCKKDIHEFNSLQTEKSSLLLKIQDLEEKLLETHLQLERVIDEKLTHMLSIQKSLTNKIGLRYAAPSFDIPSTSRTVFVKPTVLESSPTVVDKGRAEQDPPCPAPIFMGFEVIYAGTGWILSNPCGAGWGTGWGFKKPRGPTPRKKT